MKQEKFKIEKSKIFAGKVFVPECITLKKIKTWHEKYQALSNPVFLYKN